MGRTTTRVALNFPPLARLPVTSTSAPIMTLPFRSSIAVCAVTITVRPLTTQSPGHPLLPPLALVGAGSFSIRPTILSGAGPPVGVGRMVISVAVRVPPVPLVALTAAVAPRATSPRRESILVRSLTTTVRLPIFQFPILPGELGSSSIRSTKEV